MDRQEKLQQELQDEKNSRERLMGQNKSLAKQYIRIKQQLAAANARIAELEATLNQHDEISERLARKFIEKAQEQQQVAISRAEQAEAQCAAMLTVLQYVSLIDCENEQVNKMVSDIVENQEQTGTALLDHMKRMEGALLSLLALCEHGADFRNGNVYQGVDEGNVMADRIIAQVKAALEEKP